MRLLRLTAGEALTTRLHSRIDMLAILSYWIMFLLALTHAETTEGRHLYLFRALSVIRTSRLLLVTSGTAVSAGRPWPRSSP